MLILSTFLLLVTGLMTYGRGEVINFSWRLDNVSAETCEATGRAAVLRLKEHQHPYAEYECVALVESN